MSILIASLIPFREDNAEDWDTISNAPVQSIAKGSSANWKEAMLARATPAETGGRAERALTVSVSSAFVALATEETIAKRLLTLVDLILASTVACVLERNLGKFHLFNN